MKIKNKDSKDIANLSLIIVIVLAYEKFWNLGSLIKLFKKRSKGLTKLSSYNPKTLPLGSVYKPI